MREKGTWNVSKMKNEEGKLIFTHRKMWKHWYSVRKLIFRSNFFNCQWKSCIIDNVHVPGGIEMPVNLWNSGTSRKCQGIVDETAKCQQILGGNSNKIYIS